MATPSVGDAASRVLEVAGDHTGRALGAAGGGISKVYNRFAREGTEKTREAIRRRIARERAEDDEPRDTDGESKPN